MSNPRSHANSTRSRLLEAAEVLFIRHGYEGMLLREVTSLAKVNMAAVNYHFGSKEALVQELLSSRLDRLNEERLQLLSLCEARYGDGGMDASVVLSVLFVPAVRLSRDGAGGVSFMRLLGRVYSDSSPFIRGYLYEHYQPIYERFFETFARALPQMSRNELGTRLHFALKALSGILAGEDMDKLIRAICVGQPVSDSLMLSRLVAFLAPLLMTPFNDAEQVRSIEEVMDMAADAAQAADASTQAESESAASGKSQGILPAWAERVVRV